MTTVKKAINYLNNRDLLKEIHLSKNSYCVFANPGDDAYDLIIDQEHLTIQQIIDQLSTNTEWLDQAKQNRATRLGQDPSEILATDCVFRIMTWTHIPLSPRAAKKTIKRKTARDIIDLDDYDLNSNADDAVDNLFADLEADAPIDIDDMIHTRVNFPPFQHYKIHADGKALCIGKSHWAGDLDTGSFCKDQGNLTNKLAKMYLMICEKYAMKYNWRNYSYLDEMVASAVLQLTYVGLRFNEAKSNNPFAYYTQTITNSFCRVLNTEKRSQTIRDDILELNNLNPSYSRVNNQSSAMMSASD